MSTIVLDLETQRMFQEVGGHHNVHKLGISLCGVYFYDTDTFTAFKEAELADLEQYLLDHRPTIIGFNSLHFDLPVLQPYCPRLRLTDLPQVDILKDVERALGVRIKLESIAQATLLEGKSGTGLDAIRYFRANDWERLERYCLDDVRITRDVYEYGLRHNRIFYENASELRPIPVLWGGESTIADELARALASHQRVRLAVLDRAPSGSRPIRQQVTVDLRAIEGERVQVFLPDTHEERTIPLQRIVGVERQSEIAMHQRALF